MKICFEIKKPSVNLDRERRNHMKRTMCAPWLFAAGILILALAVPAGVCAKISVGESTTKGEVTGHAGTALNPEDAIQLLTKGVSQINTPPNIQLPSDASVFLCEGDSFCIDIFASDPDPRDSITLEKIFGAGAYTPVTDTTPIAVSYCFYPDTSGSYTFIFQVTDKGGLSDTDTTVITVDMNDPPVVTTPDTVIFDLCDTATVCFSIDIFDPDDGLTIEVTPPGYYTICPLPGPMICFFADRDTTYNFIIIVTDQCGASDTTYTTAIVIMNDPPVVTAPDTVTYDLSDTATVCFDISISDPDDTVHQVGCTPPGQYVASDTSICFLADHNATHDFRIIVADSCGEADTAYTTVVVNLVTNRPPVVTVPADQDTFLCQPEILCFVVEATDPDPGDSIILEMIEGPGTFVPDTGLSPLSDPACFLPEGVDSTYRFVFRATDLAGATDEDSFYVTVNLDEPPTVAVPPDSSVFLYEAETLCFDIEISDPDDSASAGVNSPWYYDSEDTSICIFASDEMTYCCTVIVTDSCELADTGIFCLTVDLNDPPTVEVASPASGGTFSYLPELNIHFGDDLGLDCGYYQIDGCTGTWTEFWSYNSNSSDTSIDWTVPSLSQGLHTIHFKATDDSGAVNGDTCSYSWSFTYSIPTVSIVPCSLSAQCGTDYILWIHLDEKIKDLDSAFFKIGYEDKYITATNVLKGPALTPTPNFDIVRVIYSDSILISMAVISGTFDGPGQILGVVFTPGSEETLTQMSIEYSALYDSEGEEIIHQTEGAEIKISCSVSVDEETGTTPSTFRLGQNYPNPYNLKTRIAYQLPQPEKVLLRIYNIRGQLVRTLVSENKPAGNHVVIWDSKSDDGMEVSSGIYLYRLRAGQFTETKKMLLLK